MNWIKRLFGSSAKPSSPAKTSSPKTSTEELRVRFQSLYQRAVHLRPAPSSEFSRLGGLPSMPADLEWPQWKNQPLAFLAQIDLSEIHLALPSFLPPTGYLYFFYDQEQSVWGLDSEDVGGWRVLYGSGDRVRFIERSAPTGLTEEHRYRAKPIRAQAIALLPDSQTLPDESFKWETDGENFHALRHDAFEKIIGHQMLGYPSPVQNADMEVECQLASNGINVGSPEGYKDARVPALKAGASDWKLLLQLDTDDDLGWMWGDAGTIYFWVREQDARRKDFSKVWLVFQCS